MLVMMTREKERRKRKWGMELNKRHCSRVREQDIRYFYKFKSICFRISCSKSAFPALLCVLEKPAYPDDTVLQLRCLMLKTPNILKVRVDRRNNKN